MLADLERIEVDFARPSEALARVTSSLEPLISRQAEQMRHAQIQASAAASVQIPLPVLVGLGLLAVALLLALASK
jgi:hypothetical protein